MVEFFALLGGGLRDAGWGRGQPPARLAGHSARDDALRHFCPARPGGSGHPLPCCRRLPARFLSHVAALSQFHAKGRRKNKNWQRIMENQRCGTYFS
jgi:hypothetical protein